MIIFVAAVIGAMFGTLQAKKRKGKPADILLYAFVYGMGFAIIGLFVTLILHRAAV